VRQASEAEKAAAAVVVEVAAAAGQTPSQVAINWVRQQAPHIIPILGARRLGQFEDNLGALAFTLDEAHLAQLNAAAPLKVVYPHTFWNEFVRRDLIFGERFNLLPVRK
jgi:aryl-alcohol dehydrogenase-like predicted oxidoreductase